MRNTALKPLTKLCAALSLALLASQTQAQTVTTIGGGYPTAPYSGYQDGHTLQARFNQPSGLAMDPAGNYLFVADYSNNVVRIITTPGNTSTSVTTTLTNSFYTNVTRGISRPVSVAVDGAANVYVLNQGNGTNGTILQFNVNLIGYPALVATNASNLTNVTAMALDSSTNLYVTAASNIVLRVALPNTVSVVGVITNPGTYLQGIVVLDNGQLALSDAGANSGIWLMNPNGGNPFSNSTKLAGFNGSGDNSDNWPVPATYAIFNHPGNIAKAGNNVLVIADKGNNRVKLLNMVSGTVALLYGVNSNYWGNPVTTTDKYPGWLDGQSGTLPGYAESRLPFGVVVAPDGSVFAAEDYYHVLRHITATGLTGIQAPPPAPLNLVATPTYGNVNLTWSAVSSATNYYVKRSTSTNASFSVINNTSATSYTDTNVLNGSTYYYVVSAVNSSGEGPDSAIASATPIIPPPPAPRIGWFDYEGNAIDGFYTVLHPISTATYHNDQLIAIDPDTNGVSTYYTLDGSNPSLGNGSTPPFYQDGLGYAQPLPLPASSDILIKAINIDSFGQVSPITTAEFLFKTANPTFGGNNGAQFTISDITTNAIFWYTTDGTDPTNASPSIGPVAANAANSATLSLVVNSNIIVKVRAFRNGYLPSGVAVQSFSPSNFVANTISFGFASGEASSDFVASPGQTFYAPVTLSTLPAAVIYSLQFNLTVTNAGPNPGPAVAPNQFGFQSMLMKPDPEIKGLFHPIPPYAFVTSGTNSKPDSSSLLYDGNWFQNLESINTLENLLTVGWLERAGKTNLYDTTVQDLIAFSLAHDDLFPNSQFPNDIIIGGYSFVVPGNATNGQTYQIQIARPSATSDGVGAPGSSVYIAAPTNGATAGGAPINALKFVTVGQRKYIAGSVYPFSWFNAGDFGSSNIVNADVEQVFQSAIYGLNSPPIGSDFFDAMDSCGNFGALDNDNSDPNAGHYTNSWISLNAAQQNALFDGNDTTINQIAFGDGNLDVCDVYVTFRRSLDPSLTWFSRFWNNGQRVADTPPNIASHLASKPAAAQPKNLSLTTVSPQVNFVAGDIQGSAGQTVQVPISATILGNYPLRVLMLNLTVEPLDGSPALTDPVQFTQTATVLGSPLTTSSDANGNFAAVWLNSTNAGLTGTVTLGILSITIPVGATASASYAIHFDHASASPNGLASFPKQTLTGLITLSSRTNSYYNDGIPDAWRLRWFGTIYNVLSISNACPSGDGISNWEKFVAGVDPNLANDFPSVNPKLPSSAGATTAIHWPTVSGKQYVIERSASLFNGPWTAIATNTGTGGDMEFDDTSAASVKFYRVLIVP